MNEHQRRLWKSMICLIDSYLKNEKEDFYEIVGKLEGALDAAEIKNKELVERWYDFWLPLEIRRAKEGNKPNRKHAISEFQEMRKFLLRYYHE